MLTGPPPKFHGSRDTLPPPRIPLLPRPLRPILATRPRLRKLGATLKRHIKHLNPRMLQGITIQSLPRRLRLTTPNSHLHPPPDVCNSPSLAVRDLYRPSTAMPT